MRDHDVSAHVVSVIDKMVPGKPHRPRLSPIDRGMGPWCQGPPQDTGLLGTTLVSGTLHIVSLVPL